MSYHTIPDGDSVVLLEVLANVGRVPQPMPEWVQGGDCFQCAVFAILQHFAKSTGVVLPVDLRGMYEKVWCHPDVGMARGGSNVTKKDAFWCQWNVLLCWWGLQVETVEDPPLDLSVLTLASTSFGPRLFTATGLVKRIRTYLEAGYLVYAAMQKGAARGGVGVLGANHVVVIDGYRKTYQRSISCGSERASWCGSYEDEIHVVCSATPEPYWISAQDWVADHGGYDMRFIRPKREKASPDWPSDAPVCPDHGARS